MNTVMKFIFSLMLLVCLLLSAAACGPKEENPQESETALITEGESAIDTEEEGTGLNDKGELDSPDYSPIIPV